MIPDTVEDRAGSIGIIHDGSERFSDLAHLRRAPVRKIQGRLGIVARGGNRLRDFVSQRGGKFSHRAQTVHTREIGLELAQPLVLLLRALAFRYVDLCGDYLDKFSASGKHRLAD